MTDLFGAYHLRARLHPLLLVAFPVAVTAFALGAADELLGRIGAALTAFGVAALLAALARDRGRRLEPALWASWGGPPTTTLLLSTSDAPSPAIETHRHHVQRLLPECEPLTDARDRHDPTGSVRTIERYTTYLRERTRDRERFPIVFDANVGYGFRRNTLGLRTVGLAVAVLSTLTAVAALILVATDLLGRPAPGLVVAIVVGIITTVLWTRATPAWVRVQANRYAEALLASAEAIDSPAATTRT